LFRAHGHVERTISGQIIDRAVTIEIYELGGGGMHLCMQDGQKIAKDCANKNGRLSLESKVMSSDLIKTSMVHFASRFLCSTHALIASLLYTYVLPFPSVAINTATESLVPSI
jgi:hypothetical protein